METISQEGGRLAVVSNRLLYTLRRAGDDKTDEDLFARLPATAPAQSSDIFVKVELSELTRRNHLLSLIHAVGLIIFNI